MPPDNLNKIIIVPSYPAPTFEDLADLASDISSVADELQVDIVDGEFVSAQSWPFNQTETDVVEELGRLMELPPGLTLELDCMILDPVEYLDTFVRIGVSRVIIHYGSTSYYEECLEHALHNDYLIGLAILPSVNFDEVENLIDKFDYVQVMGIAEVGTQGQPFDERALDLINLIRKNFRDKTIAVDGAVSEKTIPALVAAGATRLAPGSAIVNAVDRVETYENLLALANR